MAIFGNDKPTPTANGITLDEAHKIIQAARAKAEEIKVPMNIAVVDTGNNLTAFVRMDGAWLGSIDIAINKAKTARFFDMTSEDLGAASQSGESLFGINVSNDGKLIIFGGGIPLVRGGIIVGAIGVSGGSVPQDIEVAEAGAKSFNG
ncbi:MAG: heme-binding protein [Acidobacteriota bacterium]|nr:heme-binding protein [Acidobacteriota bacterium]